MCNMDCFHCCKPDCVNDSVTVAERKEQDEHDREIRKGRKYGRSLVVWNHNHTEKGKETLRRYNASEKGKDRQKRYLQTEKGKAMLRRRSQKDIASGKNAERCRAYYQRKKEKMLRELMERGAE